MASITSGRTTAIVVSVPTACAFDPHENFKNIMQVQVGRGIEDPNNTRNRYPHRFIASNVLRNGNVEEEFQAGRGLRCRVFFEIDNKAQEIVGWRYEGTEDDCAIVP